MVKFFVMGYIKNYKKILWFLKPHLGLFFLAAIIMFFSAVFAGVSIGAIGPPVDNVFTGRKIVIPHAVPPLIDNFITYLNSLDRLVFLKMLCAWLIPLFFLKGFFMFLQSFLMNDVGLRVVRDVRNKIFEKLQRLSLDFYERRHSGQIAINIISDTGLIQHSISYGLGDLIYQGFQVLVFATLAFSINWKFTLVSFIVFPAIIGPTVRLGKRIKKFTTRSQEELGEINKIISENINYQRIIKSFNLEKFQIEKFRTVNQKIYKFQKKAVKRTILSAPLTEFIGSVMGLSLFYIGGREAIAGRISFGVFGVFIGALLSMIRPMKKISAVYSLNQRAFAASERIYAILNHPVEIKDKKGCVKIDSFEREIIFEDVSFKYTTGYWVLEDINLTVKKGEKLAIVAASGEGKTTLVNLVPRFYDPQRGSIYIDGKNLRDACLKDLRKLIGIVTQDPILFNTTIRENISYGKPGATLEEIREACRLANADGFISSLPEGYETIVGERGVNLSGGERQRICIARAILKNPQILILDEATSQLDSEAEKIVQEALKKSMKGRTVFMIAHRLSTLRDATRIIVLKDGRIAEEGTHETLMNGGKIYPYLYNLQFVQSK